MEFVELERRYKNFFAPKFAILMGKKSHLNDNDDILKLKKTAEVFSVTVNNTLEGADDFSFTVNNPIDVKSNKREFPYLKEETFNVGKHVEIKIGYLDRKSLKTVIKGLITAVDVTFPANGISQLTIKGFDYSHKMMKEKRSNNYGSSDEPITYSGVVKKINDDQKYGFNLSGVEETGEKHRQIKQDHESDFDFIKKNLAGKIGFEMFVRQNTLYFRKPANDKQEVVTTLSWGKSLISFSPQVNIANQVSEVEVRHWDSNKQKAIIGIAKAGDEQGRDKKGSSGAEKVKDSQGKAVNHVWIPVASQKQANDQAKSILDNMAKELVTGNGECIGIPDILPGMNIKLIGLGNKFSKIYYIEKTTHSVSSSGYKTTFSIKENTI